MKNQLKLSRIFRLVTLLSSLLSMFVTGCGSREPVATAYKKALSNGEFGPNLQPPTVPSFGNDEPSVEDDDTDELNTGDTSTADSVTSGQAIFNSTCAGCHGPGASPGSGPVAGAGENRILSAKSRSVHSGVASSWPNQQEAKELAAYLDTL